MRARRRFSACRHFCSSSNQLLSWRSLLLEIAHLIEHWMTRSASFSAADSSDIPPGTPPKYPDEFKFMLQRRRKLCRW